MLNYLNEKSSVASNRLLINNPKINEKHNPQRLQPVQYLEDNKIELYKKFESPNKPKRSTFYKYINKFGVLKNPHRLTDLCPYCETLVKLRKSLPNNLRKYNYNSPIPNEIDIKDIMSFLKNKKQETIN